MASKQPAGKALPPVRTGGKKVPPPVARAAAPPSSTPQGATTNPTAPATQEDTKMRVAREREERMAAVRSAKAEVAQPTSARGAAAAPVSARAAPPAPAAAPKKSSPVATPGAPIPSERRASEPTSARAPASKGPSAAPLAPVPKPTPAKQPPAKEKKPTPPPEGLNPNAPVEEVPLKNPKFNLDGPTLDVTTPGNKLLVYECFQGEGMLFRIAEPLSTTPITYRWHFYNDTTDLMITAEVSFMLGSNVKLLETSTSRVDSNTGETVVRASVPPGKTQAFVEGRIRGYACSFSADEFKGEAREAQAADAEGIRRAEIDAMLKAAKEEKVDPQDQEALVRVCIKRNLPFVDTTFTGQALFYREGLDEPIDTFPLLRPTQYLPPAMRNVIRLINTVEPNDIDQGLLGDCWFLCAISSLAEFADKVEDIFEHPQGKEIGAAESKVGAYRVTVMLDGWWRTVLLDDYFPSQGGRAAYAKNIEDPAELWVSFIEKAYAKLKGSYSTIVGGDALHALEDLTGYPTTRLDRKFNAAVDDEEAAESLFQDLLRYDEAGYLITVGTPSPFEDDPPEVVKAMEEKYDELGLTVDHSYSVITVKEFPEKGIKLLKIRNPWGNAKEWSGAWGDESDEWKAHPDIAKECGFDGPSSDGTFWMQWSDVLEYFESGGVCFMSRNWRDCRTRGEFKGGRPSVALRVTCHKPTKAFLVLSQAAKPGFDLKKPTAKYAGVMVSVWKQDSDPTRYRTDLNSAFEFDLPTPEFTFLVGRSIGLLYSFKPSTTPYMVVPRIFDPDIARDYCLGIISQHSVGDSSNHALSVEFCQINGADPAFENFEQFTFDPEKDVTLVTAPYQVNPEEGAPYDGEGTSVVIRDAFGEASVRRSLDM